MKTEVSPAMADENAFHPPPRPGVPDQCQNAPELTSTAQASPELTAETETSLAALGEESPVVVLDQLTPFQKSAVAVPPLPPTAKPALGFGMLGGPKEMP